MLEYKIKKIEERIITKELQAYNDWGMFTSTGNKSITQKAKNLIKKLETIRDGSEKKKALLAFLRSYRRMSRTKAMSESSDTAVRECVWDFFWKACLAVGLDKDTADVLWELED